MPVGTICWGHITDVLEDNVRTFLGNWTGTGEVVGTDDEETVCLSAGEYMESEVVFTDENQVEILQNEYTPGDTVLIKYRDGATEENCLAASWSNYSTPFDCLGYLQVRIEVIP
jgi:hypothetical protein